MPAADEYQARPVAASLGRLATTPDQLGAALAGCPDSVLTRRPEPRSWAPTEIVCHLRDVEELFLVRFQTILAADDPKILAFAASPSDLAAWGIGGAVGHPLDPDRWAEERQYLRNDAGVAFAAFHRRRGETLALLRGLSSAQWERVGIHPARGRLPMTAWVAKPRRPRRQPPGATPPRARRPALILQRPHGYMTWGCTSSRRLQSEAMLARSVQSDEP